MPIITNLDVMLAKRKMTLSELSERIGITLPNLSRLKQGNVKGIRYNTLGKICEVLDCKPGDILDYESENKEEA
ncbi:MAG: helix-turn-helix transcriptional regulator [Candidatus Marinimicrobia bacterium]|nr:helix-turn-helix transcriptional regulator [Candidatus Neomarinimicrobiota bacterium]